MKKIPFLFLLVLLFSLTNFAQVDLRGPEKITPTFIEGMGIPEMDGELNEEFWNSCVVYSDFYQRFPSDSTKAKGQTELRMAYDSENIYVSVKCYSLGDNFLVSSLKRDFEFQANDSFTLLFDTFNDKNNAFAFGMTPMGVRREALISNGGQQRQDFSSSWDNKWQGDAKIGKDYWVAEYAIPLKTLRFKDASQQWRFNCYRTDGQNNEWSTLMHLPINRLLMDLAYMTTIEFEKPLQKPGSNISIIPYGITSVTRDFESETQTKSKSDFAAGFDAKIGLGPSLNLDLTVNPDFSQVEVDDQVTNLDRFEIFFPEKRQFFQENADLFGAFGNTRANPFFSRRIGVALDTATGLNIQNPINFGARLSGKVNPNLRLGLLNMIGAPDGDNALPTYNYNVVTFQQKVFSRSNLSFIMVNKDAVKATDDELAVNSAFNRVLGLEYRLFSADNRWRGKFSFMKSFSPENGKKPVLGFVQLERQTRNVRFEYAHLLIGEGFNAEVGFVPRKDFMLMSPEVEFYFYPKSSLFNQISLNFDSRFFLKIGDDGSNIIEPWDMVERGTQTDIRVQFQNNTQGSIRIDETWLTLLRDFDPTRLQDDNIFLPAGTDYHYVLVQGNYTSDRRKTFFYEVAPVFGSFYNGSRLGLGGGLTYRFQPYGSIGLNFNYNHIELADPFKPVDIWLVGPKIDLSFNKKLFFSTFVQYNSQIDNLNINSRLQYRFAPVSDFYLVYTDNYLVDSFSQFDKRNRALVAKLTYWLNL